jgi:hypothetical protein
MKFTCLCLRAVEYVACCTGTWRDKLSLHGTGEVRTVDSEPARSSVRKIPTEVPVLRMNKELRIPHFRRKFDIHVFLVLAPKLWSCRNRIVGVVDIILVTESTRD